MSMDRLRIATRRSTLALWQAEHIAGRLRSAHPGLEVELVPMSTRGDELLDRSLAALGGKGLFTKALETAMFEGQAELAVHSLKDLPAELPSGMTIAAMLERAEPRDALVSAVHGSLSELPDGTRIGTSSLRRAAQLKFAFPRLVFAPLRGNVNTRLDRLDRGEFDALVLAAAGLERLGFGSRIREMIAVDTCVPAIGQGVIAVECRTDDEDTRALVRALDHAPTRVRASTERAVNSGLHGHCHAPIAAYAALVDRALSLVARVGAPDGSRLIEARSAGPDTDADGVAARVVSSLVEQGAREILAAADAAE